MKVVCINDKGRPSKIPPEKWVKEGESYTVIRQVKLSIQVDKIGYQLEEIDLDETCFPYLYFDASRFAVPAEVKELENVLENYV